MTERISAGRFHEADGVGDWRVVFEGACAHFRTKDFAAGVALVDAIGRLADAADHHPDVDLRYGSVTVRLITHSVSGLSELDILLAQQISAVARELGAVAEPSAVQTVQVTIDARAGSEVIAFWQALLGYQKKGLEDLIDSHGRGPSFWFQEMTEPRTARNRLHVDVSLPHDQAEARIAAAVAAGGRVVSDENAPAWWVLADPEGNEACVATWQGRG
jgi:4a-hydroxytetrahydrobiopterin dehydratase